MIIIIIIIVNIINIIIIIIITLLLLGPKRTLQIKFITYIVRTPVRPLQQ